jgi:hypothetical protein
MSDAKLPPLCPVNGNDWHDGYVIVTDPEAEGGDIELTREQAARICDAVRLHDQLVASLEATLAIIEQTFPSMTSPSIRAVRDEARATIAKARGAA